MKTRLRAALVTIGTAALPSFAYASPVPVPEIDYKFAVGGLVVAVAGIALLIESYRRRKPASN